MIPYDDPEGRRRDRNRFLALWSAGLSGGVSGGMLALGIAAAAQLRRMPTPDILLIGAVLGIVPGLLATAVVGAILAARRPSERQVASWPEVAAVTGIASLAGGLGALFMRS